jgi:hypothetical protein
MRVLLLGLWLLVSKSTATMLYNGLQKQIFSSNLSISCDAALNTTIDCPEDIIQLVSYGIQAVGKLSAPILTFSLSCSMLTLTGWNTSSMSSLCTSGCKSSLETLKTAVEEGCGTTIMKIDGQNVTFPSWIDYMQYKFGLICLADAETEEFCLDVEKTCDIELLWYEMSKANI